MKKQYIKPFTNVHDIKVESVLFSGTKFSTNATNFNRVEPAQQVQDNYGLNKNWKWGDGDDSTVPVD